MIRISETNDGSIILYDDEVDLSNNTSSKKYLKILFLECKHSQYYKGYISSGWIYDNSMIEKNLKPGKYRIKKNSRINIYEYDKDKVLIIVNNEFNNRFMILDIKNNTTIPSYGNLVDESLRGEKLDYIDINIK